MAFDVQDLVNFLGRFDRAAKALRGRKRSKPDIVLEDEYDVQDLVFAALKPLIKDLTTENPSPKVAGTAGRVDLHSPSRGFVVEIKATLKDGRERDIPKECMAAVKLYSGVAGLSHLIFFIYDPEGKLPDIDALERDLNGLQHRNDRSGDFPIHVVGPGVQIPVLGVRTDAGGAAIVVDDVLPLPGTFGVVVGATVHVAAGARLDSVHLRLGASDMVPTKLPDSYADATRKPSVPAQGITGPDTRDVEMHFGPSDDGSGIRVNYGSSGLLELYVGGKVVERVPVDIPELKRRAISDEDARITLSSWFTRELHDEERNKAISFADTDTRLELPLGSAARLLAPAISEQFDVVKRGDDLVMFARKPPTPHRGPGGWSPSRDGTGLF